MKNLARIKIGGVGGLLLVTAIYHASGYRGVSSRLVSSSLSSELATILGGLWLFFSWHLLVVGLAVVWAAVSGAARWRPVLLFLGLVAIGDFLWVLRMAGWFPGTVLLLLAGLGLLVGGSMWPRDRAGPG